MKRIILAAACAAGALGVAACSYDEDEYNQDNYDASANAEAYGDNAAGGYATASSAWPEGARIVEEGGVTYRIDPGGERIVLRPGESRIIVEGDRRFRVDPDGTRVLIDPEGVAVRVGPEGVDATVPVGDDRSVTVNSQ